MRKLRREYTLFVFKQLIKDEQNKEVLQLWFKASNDLLNGKKIICNKPFHRLPLVHCLLEIIFSNLNITIIKRTKNIGVHFLI